MSGVPRVRMLPLLAVTLAAGLALSACGSDDPEASPGPSSAMHSSPSLSATPEPSATSTPTASAPSEGSGTHRGRHKIGLLQPRTRESTTMHLLDADRLPALGDRAWKVEETAPEEPADARAVGACQKTGLGSLGALDVVRRTFGAPGGAAATQVVARFADSRSAWRAHGVLVAWRDDCQERVGHAAVGPLEPVTVATGTADSYRGSFGRRPTGAGLAILRTGGYLVLVEVSDRAYPEAWDPARVAVRRVARTFA
jgi:hypothetical protein